MVKILPFYIIMTLIFTMSEKGLKLKFKLDDLFRILYDVMIFGNQKTTIYNVRAIEEICVIDPAK